MNFRKFTAEGAVHLFSGLPSVLCPAEIFHAVENEQLRERLVGCNLYLVTCRRRILIKPESVRLTNDIVTGDLCVFRDGWITVPFRFRLSIEHHLGNPEILDVMTSTTGTHLAIRRGDDTTLIASHIIVAEAECDLTEEERDLHVLYVGQGVGRKRSKLAIDRLSNHATLQRILADMHTYHPDVEILILMYRFDQSRTMISTGGDMNLIPTSGVDDDSNHLRHLMGANIDRRARISLAEAALINYFQPKYNVTFKKTNFSTQRKLKLLQEVLSKDLTGLMVEICSHTLRSRLRSDSCALIAPDNAIIAGYRNLIDEKGDLAEAASHELNQILHTHYANFALTDINERDTFLHGTRWMNTEERQPFL